jgi:hypothetical protein
MQDRSHACGRGLGRAEHAHGVRGQGRDGLLPVDRRPARRQRHAPKRTLERVCVCVCGVCVRVRVPCAVFVRFYVAKHYRWRA